MKEILKGLIIFLICIVLLVGLFGALRIVNLKFYNYFGQQKADIDRDIFKKNKSYIESAAQDLAKYKFELETEKDETAQKAIKEMIRSKYADFDINNLQDSKLQQFLRGIRGGF